MPDRRYEIRVTGRISQRVRDAFGGLDVSEAPAVTIIAGTVHEDAELHDLLSTIQSLGLHVMSVQQVAR
jgi:hypothetical protein